MFTACLFYDKINEGPWHLSESTESLCGRRSYGRKLTLDAYKEPVPKHSQRWALITHAYSCCLISVQTIGRSALISWKTGRCPNNGCLRAGCRAMERETVPVLPQAAAMLMEAVNFESADCKDAIFADSHFNCPLTQSACLGRTRSHITEVTSCFSGTPCVCEHASD